MQEDLNRKIKAMKSLWHLITILTIERQQKSSYGHAVLFYVMIFSISQPKNEEKTAIMDSDRLQGAVDGDFFLVVPDGIRNICAKF